MNEPYTRYDAALGKPAPAGDPTPPKGTIEKYAEAFENYGTADNWDHMMREDRVGGNSGEHVLRARALEEKARLCIQIGQTIHHGTDYDIETLATHFMYIPDSGLLDMYRIITGNVYASVSYARTQEQLAQRGITNRLTPENLRAAAEIINNPPPTPASSNGRAITA